MKETALLDGTPTLGDMVRRSGVAVTDTVSIARRGEMRDVLGIRMLRADLGHSGIRCFAGFGEGIIAGIEVLSLLPRIDPWVNMG